MKIVFCGVDDYRPKAFPKGEGGFFNVQIWTLKKTEEVLTQYGFAAGDQ